MTLFHTHFGHNENGSLREQRMIFKGPPVFDSPTPEERKEKPLGGDGSKEIKLDTEKYSKNFDDVVKMIDAFVVDGEMHVQEEQALADKIEATLTMLHSEFKIDPNSKSAIALLQIARDRHFIDDAMYNAMVDKMQFAKTSKKIEKPKVLTLDEQFLRLSPEEMHAKIQDAKQSAERFRRDARRSQSRSGSSAYSQYWHLRELFEQAHGKNYSMYLRERRGAAPDFSSVRNALPIPGTNLMRGQLPDGRSITFNPRTGSSMSDAPQEESSESRDLASSSGVSTDQLADAKYRLDRGVGRGGHRLPQSRINHDGSVNFFTQGDMQDVRDFRNAQSRKTLARLERQEEFAARHADIMDILTNPERFEEEFQKMKDAPIDYEAPGIMARARKNNIVSYLLTKDHSMPHPVAREVPTNVEIEALRNGDPVFRDSWEKVRRKSENMMNYDQFITFEQMGWDNADTRKFVPKRKEKDFIPGYAYIYHKPSVQEIVLDEKGKIVRHTWQKKLQGGQTIVARTGFERPERKPLRSVLVDFEKTWEKGVPGKLALRDHDGKTIPGYFTIDLATFPRDGRGLQIGNVAWIEREGDSAFRVSFFKDGHYDLHAMEGGTKARKYAMIAAAGGQDKKDVA